MTLWLHERKKYLLEFIRLEGHGNYASRETCQGHSKCTSEPGYHCQDCFGTELYCQECIVNRHRKNPLYKIEFWNGSFFEDTTLKYLRLRVQLGHPVGKQCFNHSRAYDDDFIILNINGIHELALYFCSCESALSHTNQILRARWYPVTSIDPKSAAMFCLLEHLHMLTFKSKASAFKYWQTLVCLTDNTGIKPCKDRYDSLLRMIKQWRHDPTGINATAQGSCAVVCPACPHPGKNLPEDWKVALLDKQWLYAQFLAIDVNLRLARKNVSSDRIDPGLSRGWAYFIEETGFKGFLTDVGTVPQEKSTCASHNAVNLAETKNLRGLAATGAGSVNCSHHNFKRPYGVGDLQKGEKYVFNNMKMFPLILLNRYINMDYLFLSTMQHSEDIIQTPMGRMSKYPSRMHFMHDGKIMTFLVPKFHLPAHITTCQIMFSHNLIKGMGRTDDTLDDHFSDYNWKKVTNFGVSLLSKIKVAIPEREVAGWKEAIENWEADTSNKNPFETTTITLTQAAVCLKLSQQEAEDLERGFNKSLHMEVSHSILISSGMDLEEQQFYLQQDHNTLSSHPTDLQQMKLQERSNALLCKIEQWCHVHNQLARRRPTEIKLWLPSKLKEAAEMSCDEQLCEYEWELRCAQAYKALDDVHWQLHLRAYLYKFKDTYIWGQRANTRASAVLRKAEQTIGTAAAQYCRAWVAVKILSTVLDRPNWEVELPQLLAADVRGMSEGDIGQSEGNHTLSWIWKTVGWLRLEKMVRLFYQKVSFCMIGCTELSLQLVALRIKWCKSRVHASCWAEEVELLQEEMRCVVSFLSWHAGWWEEQASQRMVLAAPEQEGVCGYARRQAALRRAM
ncbi:uncharacterized protein EDB93DRAFT_1242432 [Suillus bovinus]|uniref:uncharacterized protein n=1 Tax=Suillus bovinus TaxID=48563 RepID=UPI001B86724E|nr:uncharacterized protein EDB93DRAFT_1242432 [Suillus bovinus]KAG2136089.1 hypothetical protein EDB93DRAFT_1242432 [Suillus bovinus]